MLKQILALIFCVGLPAAAVYAEDGIEWSREAVQPLLQTYCLGCHNAEKHKGDFDLSRFDSHESMLRESKQWREVLRVLKEEEMPPQEPLPTDEERQRLIEWVDQSINKIDWSKHRHAGHVTIPRLTKDEYNNTLRDLLGIDVQPGSLFTDDGQGESGFNNDRDALFITPAQLEKYLIAADRALDAVISLNSDPMEMHFESEKMFMTETRETPNDFKDGFVGYVINRGQMTLYDSVRFPFDGIYEFTVRARSTAGPTGARLRIDDQKKADIVVPSRNPDLYKVTCFVAEGSHQMTWNIQQPRRAKIQNDQKSQPEPPKSYTLLPKDAGTIINQQSAKNAPQFPIRNTDSEEIQKLIKRVNSSFVGVQRPIEWLRLHGPNGNPAEINRFQGYITERTVSLEQAITELHKAMQIDRMTWDMLLAESNQEKLADNKRVQAAVADIKRPVDEKPLKPGSVAIDWIQVRGPIRPEGVSPRVFTHQPSKTLTQDEAARKILSEFASRAFRRSVSEDELRKYYGLYQTATQRGDAFQAATKLALTAILVSPNFLFRVEQGTGDAEFALNDYQIASRLSYFLWQSMPDDELFELAGKQQLQKPDVLRAQTRRMLADPKSRAFVETFTGQWLGFDLLGETVIPDEKLFPQFTEDLSEAMKLETVLLFESLLTNNESLLKLISNDQTFLNEQLAEHYGIDNVRGEEMQVVSLKDPNRGGLLGMGSVLTATSSPTRTSPVVRGKWVLETLLGVPAGDPPPDAGALPGNAGQKKGLTLREEFMEHRRNPSCAVCHDKIDPIGFGLESFDAIGRFRTKENGKPIDSMGQLPDGTTFEGPAELKQYLLNNHQEEFVRNASARLLSFALGRKLQYYDEPGLNKIVESVISNDYGAETLVMEIVTSYPFLHQSPTTEPELNTTSK